MLIGELSQRSGFSRDTIRFYEKMGLIEVEDANRRGNTYKEYTENILRRLIAIRKIKDYGFTLEEMRGLFILHEEGVLEPQRGKKWVTRKIARIDEKIAELQMIRERLIEVVNGDEASCGIHQILMDGVS